jgi:hypothetical protein
LLGGAENLAAHLRASDLVVICAPSALMIEATANVEDKSEPVADEPDNDRPQQLPLSLRPRGSTGRSTQKFSAVPAASRERPNPRQASHKT